tara:strand:+ start:249 stop:488 length:240 start_codon:yes stop_codon:yes gene_type:complete
MCMVVVATVMDHTTVMVTTQVVDHTGVDHNLGHTTKIIMHTDTKHTVHGVRVVMDLSMVTEVLEDVKVLLWSRNSSDKY